MKASADSLFWGMGLKHAVRAVLSPAQPSLYVLLLGGVIVTNSNVACMYSCMALYLQTFRGSEKVT